jgi:molybdate transport system substrate-binding protein
VSEPAAGDRSWGGDWEVGLRAWVERDGHVILGKGRLELLEAIDRWHSISAAARQIGMSYRHAWLLVQGVNEAAGEPLVEAATGGRRGGGARLTPRGRAATAIFRELQEHLHLAAAGLLPRLVAPPESAALHVAAAVSLQEALGQLLADYALRQPAVRVRVLYGASDELAYHLLAGAPADLFLTAAPEPLDRLQAAHLLRPGSRVAVAENTLAALSPSDWPVPVRKPADLRRPEVARLALAGPTCPLGAYARAWLEAAGLGGLLPRAVLLDNSVAVVAALRAGRADVGLIYASDAARAEGCRLLFRVRHPSVVIRYEAAALAHGHLPGPAQALLDFLTSPAAATRFRRCGLLPVGHAAAP